MKNLTLIISVILTLAGVATSHSAEQLRNITITRVYQYEDLIVIAYYPASSNIDGCTKTAANSHFAIPLTTDPTSGIKKGLDYYATILAAKMNDIPIGAGVRGCHLWGDGTIPVVYRVDLY